MFIMFGRIKRKISANLKQSGKNVQNKNTLKKMSNYNYKQNHSNCHESLVRIENAESK